ncbi:TIM barrel protein [Gracilibacillus sp. YIM 98692]|uniref:sugar phosphate isomerase/epimerase family protein n=1 Tax=Gracilibacillus sp. YIM 98692 TaxID=2663532 RepID=UPI0013D82B6F|nr:TIM barrel protein [Gracilibacillus sp. YIM 98692]
MRLGGPIQAQNPEDWAAEALELGYSAATLPKNVSVNDISLQNEYVKTANAADIVIAEVGAWSNPLSTDEKKAKEALQFCKDQLAIADKVGAKCCVNIVGSKGEKWDGPHPNNLTEDTFALIVDRVRSVIDAVKPKYTYYTLEPMPWMYPNDIESYFRLIKAIDRPQFGVHLDPINMISSVERYYNNSEFIKECFRKLGRYIKSCHIKDIIIQDSLTLHLDEVRPGQGTLDINVYLEELNKLPKDIPLLLEHLPTDEEYRLGAEYIRKLAKQKNYTL